MRLPKHTQMRVPPQISSILDKTRTIKWVLLPLRLFLGITFMYAGFQKLTDPQFFEPGSMSYIGNQMLAFAQASPLHDLLTRVVIPNALVFGLLIAYGEIAIGLGTLFGFLARPAALFGFIISTMFFLTATWRVQPYFYGSDIVFMVCWLTIFLNGIGNTGIPSLDEQFALYFVQRTKNPKRKKFLFHFFRVLLGVPRITSSSKSARSEWQPTTSHTAFPPPGVVTGDLQTTGKTSSLLIRPPFGNLPGQGNRLSQPLPAVSPIGQRPTAPLHPQPRITGQLFDPTMPEPILASTSTRQGGRRNFLLGIFTGVGSTLGVTAITYAWRILSLRGNQTPKTIQGTPDPKTTPGANSTPTPPPPPAENAIAQANSIRLNSSVNFTVPGSNTAAILIHLSNDQFVAYEAICTHAGCIVNYEAVSQRLVCPCHGAQYDPANQAQVVNPPATIPLKPVAIQVNSTTGDIVLAG